MKNYRGSNPAPEGARETADVKRERAREREDRYTILRRPKFKLIANKMRASILSVCRLPFHVSGLLREKSVIAYYYCDCLLITGSYLNFTTALFCSLEDKWS
jgi:hypothetical protein